MIKQQIRVIGIGQTGDNLFEQQKAGWYVLAGGSRIHELELPKDTCAKIHTLAVEVQTKGATFKERFDVPLDYSIDATEKVIAPPYRGGALVTFPIQRTQSFTGMLEVETAGKSVIPAFGQITVTFEGEEVLSPIGKSGEFYLENLTSGRFQAKVELKRVCVGRQLLVQQRERGELRPVQCVHQQPHRLHRHHYPHLHGRGPDGRNYHRPEHGQRHEPCSTADAPGLRCAELQSVPRSVATGDLGGRHRRLITLWPDGSAE